MKGKELQEVIKEKLGITQAEFARKADIPSPTLSTILRHEVISGVNAARIQRVFDAERKHKRNE